MSIFRTPFSECRVKVHGRRRREENSRGEASEAGGGRGKRGVARHCRVKSTLDWSVGQQRLGRVPVKKIMRADDLFACGIIPAEPLRIKLVPTKNTPYSVQYCTPFINPANGLLCSSPTQAAPDKIGDPSPRVGQNVPWNHVTNEMARDCRFYLKTVVTYSPCSRGP